MNYRIVVSVIVAFLSLATLTGPSLADTNYLIELQQEAAQLVQALQSRKDALQQSERLNKAAEQSYQQARKARPSSNDYRYHVAKYREKRGEALLVKTETLVSMGAISNDLLATMGRFIAEVEKTQRRQDPTGAQDGSTDKVIDDLKAVNSLFRTFERDPEINSLPEFGAVRATYQAMIRNTLQAGTGYEKNIERLTQGKAAVEGWLVLIDAALKRLRAQYHQQQVLSLTETASFVSDTVNNIAPMTGVLFDEREQETERQTDELIEKSSNRGLSSGNASRGDLYEKIDSALEAKSPAKRR